MTTSTQTRQCASLIYPPTTIHPYKHKDHLRIKDQKDETRLHMRFPPPKSCSLPMVFSTEKCAYNLYS